MFWYSPAIASFIQGSSASSSNASYTRLMIRNGETSTLEFGDTEYIFGYMYPPLDVPFITINIPFHSNSITNPQIGHTYNSFGVEIKVENLSSDYLSAYAIILVKSTVANYMFSTYHYTKVDIPIGGNKTVTISSGITNESNQYTFGYINCSIGGVYYNYGTLSVQNSSQSRQYRVYLGEIVAGVDSDFNIQIGVYKADSNNMIIYVKPLY